MREGNWGLLQQEHKKTLSPLDWQEGLGDWPATAGAKIMSGSLLTSLDER